MNRVCQNLKTHKFHVRQRDARDQLHAGPAPSLLCCFELDIAFRRQSYMVTAKSLRYHDVLSWMKVLSALIMLSRMALDVLPKLLPAQ